MAGAAYNVKFKYFFDRPEVLRRLETKEARDLSRIGAYAMTVVRRSMRSGGKSGITSRPGEPPRYHTKLLRDGILFAYQQSTHSVVIGPRKLNGRASERVPKVLNEGGTVVVNERVRKQSRDRRGRFGKNVWVLTGKKVVARIAPRPYIGPRAATWAKIIAKWREITERHKL